MTLMTLPKIMDRIKTATPQSRIAVFVCPEPGYLDAVFAATTETNAVIASGSAAYLGSFHGDMDLKAVRGLLESHIRTNVESP